MDIKLIIFNIDKVCKIVRKNIQYLLKLWNNIENRLIFVQTDTTNCT